MQPNRIIILCGKRKCGKDYIANSLRNMIGLDECVILTLSSPLKKAYAEENNLDYEKLLSDSDYKEGFRKDMILWGENKRNKDSGYFVKIVIDAEEAAKKGVWIISDARRKSDIEYFMNNYDRRTVIVARVYASEDVRKARNYTFTKGVDDVTSECGLDCYNCDYDILNNGQNVLQDTDYISILNWITDPAKPDPVKPDPYVIDLLPTL